MRELFVVEALVQILYVPFVSGDYNLKAVKGTDVIAKACKKAYNLVKAIG